MRLSSLSSSCSESGDGYHTSSTSESVKPSALTLIEAAPPAVAATDAWATHPETLVSVPLDIASLVHLADAAAEGAVPGRELTAAVRMALLTATPVRGALFCSEAAPPSG
eukprot:scaffold15480_cov66-Phaeocystis_antarctica.AAC.3